MTNAVCKLKFFIVNLVLIFVLANAALAQAYTKNSFPTFSGGTIFCNGNDIRLECRDSGDGENHRCVSIGANGCQAFEGPDNYGSPGCLIVCQTVPQPVQRCGDGTIFGQCSFNVPLFCDNGLLVNKASFCGCQGSFTISGDNCIAPVSGGSGGAGGGSGGGAGGSGVSAGAGVSGNQLSIIDIDAKIDGKKSSNIRDNGEISKKAKPGSDVELKITVKNGFNLSQDIDIENIQVVVTIEGIDNGNDIGAESNEFDLRAQGDKTVTLKFKLPLNVDEDTYNLFIEAEGEDKNGNEQRDEANIDLKVEKGSHDLRYLSFSLSPLAIGCDRIITLFYKIINVGKEDEIKSALEIKNDDLGLKFVENGLAVQAEKGANVLTRSVKLNVSSDAKTGSYPLISSIITDLGDVSDVHTAEFNVEDCRAEKEEVVLIAPAEQAARLIKNNARIFLPFYAYFSGIGSKTLILASLILIIVVLLVFIAAALLLRA